MRACGPTVELVGLNARLFDDGAPPRNVVPHQGTERFRWREARHETLLQQGLLDVVEREDSGELARAPGDDFGRQPGGAEDAVPQLDVYVVKAKLLEGGRVGREDRAL